MARSLDRCIQTSFARGAACVLPCVVIMIRMTVTPIPISPLVPLPHFNKRMILSVPLAEIRAVGTIFVVIPIVVVLVGAVVNPVLVIIVAMAFFLTPVVLRPGRRTHCCWSGKGCSKKKETE